MGMNYVWSGSASYPRFNKELEEIAKILGAQKTYSKDTFYYHFYEPINYVVAEWIQNPYEYYSLEEVKEIWKAVQQHPEIKDISWQIWNELEECVEFEAGWHIY